jgi:hypothetical protein
MNNQVENLNEVRASQAPHTQLELLNTQMNAKILQMQDKHLKVSRLKFNG